MLERCLSSIPDIDDIQVIVVDDNSSPDIVDFEHFPGLERRFTQVVFDMQGKGAGHARNVALPLVRGKWLMFADADDFFTADFYDTVCSYKESEYDLILFYPESVMSDNVEKSSHRKEGLLRFYDRYFNGSITSRELALKNSQPWNKMIRRSLVSDNNIRFDVVESANDVIFSINVSCLARNISVSEKIIYVYTQRKGSITYKFYEDSSKIITLTGVHIRANRLLKHYGQKQSHLLNHVYYSLRKDLCTFCTVMWMLLKNGMLFSGVATLLTDKNEMRYLWNKVLNYRRG